MSRMVRKQVYIEAEQDALLKKRAKELGVSEAELIRRGIEQVLQTPIVFSPDLKLWEEEKEFIEQRRQAQVTQPRPKGLGRGKASHRRTDELGSSPNGTNLDTGRVL